MTRDEDLLAYCGLYCGDCAGHTGAIADAAQALVVEIERYRFDRSAKALFSEQLPDYERFSRELRFVCGLGCETACRARKEPCEIAACCLSRGYHACYECDAFEHCDKLSNLEGLHGDSCVSNLRAIREMGLEDWIARGKRLWFGSDVDGEEGR